MSLVAFVGARPPALRGASQLVDAGESGFDLSSYADLPADGATTRGFTFTARNAAGTALAGKAATVESETLVGGVSLSNSYVTVSAATEATNTNVTVDVYLRDASNRPIPDIDVSRLTTTSSGTGNTFGSWTGRTDQYGRVSRTFQSSVAEAKTITATAFGQTITDTAVVTVGGGGSGYLLEADWGTATGNTENAVTDGGLAIAPRYCLSQVYNVLSVVSQSTLSDRGISWSRTPNVLSVRSIADACGHVEFEHLFPTPATDTYWTWRYYACNGAGQTNTKLHPHCLWPVGAIEGVHTVIETRDQFDVPLSPADGRWSHGMSWGGVSFPWYANDGSEPRRILSADTWYRVEMLVHWLSNTNYRIYPRLSTLAGTLLNDVDTYRHPNPTYGILADWYAGGGYFTRIDIDNVRTLSFGMGQSGGSNGYYYVGDVKARTATGITDFIGGA